jgi:hypothetical protein
MSVCPMPELSPLAPSGGIYPDFRPLFEGLPTIRDRCVVDGLCWSAIVTKHACIRSRDFRLPSF